MNQLLALTGMRFGAFKNDEAMAASAKKLGMTVDDLVMTLPSFFDVQTRPGGVKSYDRSATKTNLLIHTFLVGALWAEKWSLTKGLCEMIAKDMKIYTDAVEAHLVRIGCAKRNQHDTSGLCYEVVVPLKPEIVGMRQRRKVQKNW